MKTEIGFAFHDDAVTTRRLRMIIHPETQTEATLLKAFALGMGWPYQEAAWEVAIEEPRKPPLGEPISRPRDASDDALADKVERGMCIGADVNAGCPDGAKAKATESRSSTGAFGTVRTVYYHCDRCLEIYRNKYKSQQGEGAR